jgi:DNA-binding MarR family transcriptional regulator
MWIVRKPYDRVKYGRRTTLGSNDDHKQTAEGFDVPAVGGLLRMVWQIHRDRMYERVVAAGYPDVTQAHFALLRFPGVDGMRPSEAAELAGLSKQSVNDLLGELERAGYLTREPHPTDGRGRIVRLTQQGERLQHTTHQISRELEADWSAEIGEKRITALKKTLGDMIATSRHKT